MVFAQRFAVPCLLFLALSRIDLQKLIDWQLLLSFYAGTLSCFIIAAIAARLFFNRSGLEAVTVGFTATFANSVLLGLPIVERAYGGVALDTAFTIIAFHAATCYFIGITTMETVLASEGPRGGTLQKILKAMFSNPLMIGVGLGFAVNLIGLTLPEAVIAPIEFMARAVIGTALFALGGILVQYGLNERFAEIGMVTVLRLIWHPFVGFALSHWVFGLDMDIVRGIVVVAAMAPGVNTYVFANIYGGGKGTAASSILIGTALSVLSVSLWLYILS